MPIHEYKCEKCGKIDTMHLHMTDDVPKKIKCPNCGTVSMLKVWGGCAINIPDDWNETKIKFNKSPSGRKHIF